MNITEILNQAETTPLTREQIVALLNTDNHSPAFYQLLSKANEMSRKAYRDKGYVFLQIGLNNAPCSGNCKFCSLAASHYGLAEEVEKSEEEILAIAGEAAHKIDALFLMTTADYPVERFLEIGRKVKALLPENVLLIANIGDFGQETAKKLKEAGFTGVYHIVRLNEGVDTELSSEIRIATLDAIASAGLDLIYCVEPIGPEHTYDQIAEEILRARHYHVDRMSYDSFLLIYVKAAKGMQKPREATIPFRLGISFCWTATSPTNTAPIPPGKFSGCISTVRWLVPILRESRKTGSCCVLPVTIPPPMICGKCCGNLHQKPPFQILCCPSKSQTCSPASSSTATTPGCPTAPQSLTNACAISAATWIRS